MIYRNIMKNKYILNQILAQITQYQFNKIVAKYSTGRTPKKFTYWEQFICLSYGQLTQKESLRNIVLCLNNRSKKLYHLGIRSKICLSTLSEANRNRSYVIYKNLAYLLIEKANKTIFNRKIFNIQDTSQYAEFNDELPGLVYVLDASTIDLCLNVFRWAKFRKKKVELSSTQYLI